MGTYSSAVRRGTLQAPHDIAWLRHARHFKSATYVNTLGLAQGAQATGVGKQTPSSPSRIHTYAPTSSPPRATPNLSPPRPSPTHHTSHVTQNPHLLCLYEVGDVSLDVNAPPKEPPALAIAAPPRHQQQRERASYCKQEERRDEDNRPPSGRHGHKIMT